MKRNLMTTIVVAIFVLFSSNACAFFDDENFPTKDVKKVIARKTISTFNKYSDWGDGKSFENIKIIKKVKIKKTDFFHAERPSWMNPTASLMSNIGGQAYVLFVVYDGTMIDVKGRSHRVVGMMSLYARRGVDYVGQAQNIAMVWSDKDQNADMDLKLEDVLKHAVPALQKMANS